MSEVFEVQTSLREILDDPALAVYWWDWERGCYVDVEGAAGDATEGLVVP